MGKVFRVIILPMLIFLLVYSATVSNEEESFEKGLEDKDDFDDELMSETKGMMRKLKKNKNDKNGQDTRSPLIGIKHVPFKDRIPKINIAIGKRPILIGRQKKRRRRRRRRKRPIVVHPEPEVVINVKEEKKKSGCCKKTTKYKCTKAHKPATGIKYVPYPHPEDYYYDDDYYDYGDYYPFPFFGGGLGIGFGYDYYGGGGCGGGGCGGGCGCNVCPCPAQTPGFTPPIMLPPIPGFPPFSNIPPTSGGKKKR